ncbi:hypothetical protein COX95_04170 [bacterium CG_4_10_14_0_2_um_filter_33_32]|nr:MAG: hypothetical protein AUJ93_01435 [bacterium CG2_30_33_46]PIR67501.1 MAG: hypothetical protein COU50_03095 [bacterium CG10_big_fil_rev_8_21_14_0_10_33_18]PIY85824.1 MAG: hypothetical protein COY76_00005 [bacterium CG_4_10_14_0_8_um_filter_33_57]PIZ85465.1 MAG: hypothetical protein COX95_04170 [bacterium CG_4_10_14_0_2_um_filter_33_32]PJA72038.1 MAG: hypothetical protein CO152_03380 [bacterium CG_4_9_14_3_um_filter_33_26]
MKKIIGIILAAGRGTRLNEGKPSDIPKVLHLLGGRPMILYCIDTLKEAGIDDIILVVGHKGYLVKETVGNDVKYAVQDEQLGTAHAVSVTKEFVLGKADYFVILNGDNPLFSKETISKLVNLCIERDAFISLVTVAADDPKGYGRIIKNKRGGVLKIVEDKDATTQEKAIKEINAGCYCFKGDWLWDHLEDIELSSQGEYYLTDLIGIAFKQGKKVMALKIKNSKEAIGINTPNHLDLANKVLKEV